VTFDTCRNFAKCIHKSNEVESLSILAHIHDFGHVESFLAWLKAQFDGENCPHRTWDVPILA
jgi:hypothetical protein